MLAIKVKNNVQIAKTFSNNENGKMNKIFVDEDIENKVIEVQLIKGMYDED